MAAGGIYVLENPQNSLLVLHERYIGFLKLLQSAGVTASSLVLVKLFFCLHVASFFSNESHVRDNCNCHFACNQDLQSCDVDEKIPIVYLEAYLVVVLFRPHPST